VQKFIEWKSLPFKRYSGKEKVRCPSCDEQRSDKRDKSLQVSHDDGFGKCHYCSALTFKDQKPIEVGRKIYTAIPPNNDKVGIYSKGLLSWCIDVRNISEKTLIGLGITEEKRFQPALNTIKTNIVFNYYEGDTVVNKKFRSKEKAFTSETGGKPILYNINAAVGAEELWIVEGEFDVAAMKEWGVDNVVGLPNGANDNDEYWINSEKYIKDIKRFIIGTDNDEKGILVRDKIAQRLGRYRCKYVEWRGKDANEDLINGDIDVSISLAKSFPVGGTHSINDLYEHLVSLYENGLPETISPKKSCFGELPKIFTTMKGHLVVGTGIPSHGKALWVEELIPTVNGFKRMIDLEIGDRVFDENGVPCNVVWKSQVWSDRPTYKITFSDNSVIVCDERHEWLVDTWESRRSEANAIKNNRQNIRDLHPKGTDQTFKRSFSRVLETKDMLNNIKVKSDSRSNYSIKICKSLQLENNESLLVDPYVLGIWLSDGNTSSGSITTADRYILDRIESLGYVVNNRKSKYHYGIKGLTTMLRTIGVLNNKHIPDSYLFSSESQRMELLRGLMDGDGHSNLAEARCEYVSIKESLALDVYSLICSLGIKATINKSKAKLYGRITSDKYRIFFKTDKRVFNLPRKQQTIDLYFDSDRGCRGGGLRYIKNIERVYGYDTQCIEVDSRSHLFLAGRQFIPTHNSSFTDWYLLNIIDEYPFKMSLFSPEHSPMELHLSKYASLAIGKPFFKGSDRITMLDLERFRDWSNERIYFTSAEDGEFPTWTWLFNKMKEQLYTYGINIFVIDAFNKVGFDKGQEGKSAIDSVLTKLTLFAQMNDVIIFLIAHPTKMKKDVDGVYEIPSLYDVSGSSDFRNQTHDGYTIYRYFGNEFEDGYNIFVNLKTKFDFQGKIGGIVRFSYHLQTGRYFADGCPPYLGDMTIGESDVKQERLDEVVQSSFYLQNDNMEDAPF
jgi:5S rRNA maturation endonuclease (ribonuclease M5)